MTNKELRKELEELAEPEFQKFAASLIPNIPAKRVLGVRLPRLRKIARVIAKENGMEYLERAVDDSYEETMLQGMVIGYMKLGPQEFMERIERFLPKIDNWSVCDSFCTGLKATRDYKDEMWAFIQSHFKSDKEYTVRFAVVMLIFYFVEEPYLIKALELLEQVDYDSYYVKMAVAWAVSIYYIHFEEAMAAFLQTTKLDDFTYNKSLQKICESRQVSPQTKKNIRLLKR